MGTKKRKTEHIDICVKENVDFEKSNGFERYSFTNNALPEVDFNEIDMSTKFLGKEFKAPFFIEAITGGFEGAEKINKNLAKAAEELGIGMGLGSQRAMIENPELSDTYKIRDVAPSIFLLGNIGGFQINHFDIKQIKNALEAIGANGLAIHLNPCQEIAQKEGDTNAKEILEKIKHISAELGYPVVVKEVGCGISGTVAKNLESAGVSAIDVAGAGGTSWPKVESFRNGSQNKDIIEWGIPTAECLEQCKSVNIPLIASGGIRTGMDCAKALAMGADLVGIARPLLKPAMESSEKVKEYLENLIHETRQIMFLVGAKNLEDLKNIKLDKNY